MTVLPASGPCPQVASTMDRAQHAERSRPGTLRLEVLTATDDLRAIAAGWHELAVRALEPNPFFAADFLLAQLERRGPLTSLRLLVVRRADGTLAGLLPVLPAALAPARAIRTLRTAYTPAQPHGLLGTPLVDAEQVEPTLDVLLDGLDRGLGAGRLLELIGHTEDGPFARILEARLRARRQPYLVLKPWERRLFRCAGSAEDYLARALGARHRSELRRQRRQLERQGALQLRRLAPGEDVRPWVRAYLELEAAGWKGRSGTALARDAGDRAFFEAMCERMHARGLLAFDALELEGRPIAMACSLKGSPDQDACEYVFKITYDERFARQSPGMQLQLALLEQRHGPGPRPRWVDSCAAPTDSFYTQLWLDRRRLGHLLIGPRRQPWPAVLEAIRLARRLRDRWRASGAHKDGRTVRGTALAA